MCKVQKKERKKMLRVFEAFAGVGSQRMALRNLKIPHQVVGISEIDSYAIQAYEAIHGDCPNYGDVSKLDPTTLPDFDLFTYSFPCQDLSVAGQGKGLIKGQTRSGLLYECEKIIEAKRPKYLLLENVKNLVGKRFKPQFDEWLSYLEQLGYTNYWKVLNAKDFNVPQNRERVFVVSILGGHSPYQFPTPLPSIKRIKDLLEPEVEEKYYLNKPFKLVNKGHQAEFLNMAFEQGARIYSEDHIMRTLGAKDRGQNNILVRATVDGLNTQNARVLDSKGICSALDTMQGGHRQPKILESITQLSLFDEQSLEAMALGLSEKDFRVRKLTSLECWRLMGFSDEDYWKAKNRGISNTQLYKQAGNSIVVPVLEGIFKELF